MAILGMTGVAKAQEPVTSFFEDFEDGTLGVMTVLDGDFDGINWMNSSTLQAQGDGHNGSLRYAYSESWTTVMRPGLTPDNFLVTPLIAVTETSVFTFFVCSDWYQYVGEHYGVAISTKSNTEPTDFTTIAEWTLTDKGTRDADQGPWHEHNIELSEYAGQNIYVAIRHFECSNIYRIDVDDISVTTEEIITPAPTNFTGELNDATITLGWEAAEGAASYNVYRSNTGTDYEIIANVTETQYEEEITENGDYYYQVTAVFADGESDPATTPEGDNVIMFNVSGLGIAENNVNVSLYPNPSDGAFNVSCPGMTKITIYGLCGETVIDIDTKADSHVVSDLDAGVYFIRIETAKGSITQKIVRL